MEWYYAEGEESRGPVSVEEFRGLVESGRITARTMVWRQGMDDWIAYGKVRREAEEGKPAVISGGGYGRTPNGRLTARARASLQGRWGVSIGVCVLAVVISVVAVAVPLLSVLVSGPLVVGLGIFFLALVRGSQPEIEMLFEGFKFFLTALVASVLMGLLVMLWSLLLIIPGIIAMYAYSQTFLIIADDSSIGPLEALKRSRQIMKGNKWKYFCLNLRFLGWSLLCLLTPLWIGYLWLYPYMMASLAHFYEDIRGPAEETPSVIDAA